MADGLYPYKNAFKICEENGWKFIFVLQNGSLKSVQEELTLSRLRKPADEYYTIKCGDYEPEHKYCRKSYNGLKNYYTLLQIAHAINQLIEKGKLVTAILKL